MNTRGSALNGGSDWPSNLQRDWQFQQAVVQHQQNIHIANEGC